jgi:hypothetical protein
MKSESVWAPNRMPRAVALATQAYTPASPFGKNLGFGS